MLDAYSGGIVKPPSTPAPSLAAVPGATAPIPKRLSGGAYLSIPADFTAIANSPNEAKPRLGSASAFSVTVMTEAAGRLASSCASNCSRSIEAFSEPMVALCLSNVACSSADRSRASSVALSVTARALLTSVALRAWSARIFADIF